MKSTAYLTVIVGCVVLFVSRYIDMDVISMIGYIVTIVLFLTIMFNKYLWKLKIIQDTTKIRKIQGKWVGKIISNGKEYNIEEFIIKQSFKKYKTCMRTKESTSESEINELDINDFDNMELKYLYTNTPKVVLREKSPIHCGIAKLEYKAGKLSGEYWTDRFSKGTIELERTNNKSNYDLINIKDILSIFL